MAHKVTSAHSILLHPNVLDWFSFQCRLYYHLKYFTKTLKSKDPKIGEKFVVFAEFTTTIILAQRIVNLLTGTVFGEIGQAWGRKKLVLIALTGYAVGSLTMLIGYLTSKPNTWEACYQPCFAAKTNKTTAESAVRSEMRQGGRRGRQPLQRTGFLLHIPRHNWHVRTVCCCSKFVYCGRIGRL